MAVSYDRTLNDVLEFIKEQGFFYTEEQVYNFYISLRTKPFVIISGISGSGKSKIADLFAEYMSNSYGNSDNYELIAVKPNWTDSRGIFGYHNLLNDTYQATPVVRLFLRALANPSKPYFLVLDEMNLAKVEYYFSDFLSLIESRRLDIFNLSKFDDIFHEKFNKDMTLSQAIILAALLHKDRSNFSDVETYRTTAVAKWWKEKYFKGTDNNWTPQFRSELNQGRETGTLFENGYKADGTRLAGKAFWAKPQGNAYKLKDVEDMNEHTLKNYMQVLNTLELCGIKQEKIGLHLEKQPLKTQINQEDFNQELYCDGGNYYVPSELEIPLNVFVIGTVNVDETTYMFSPKVLDRSNVIEFNDVDLFNAYGYGNETSDNTYTNINAEKKLDLRINIATSDDTKKIISKYPTTFSIIVEIFELLKNKNKHFGYRVFNEISLFILNFVGDSAEEEEEEEENLRLALDLQVLQKILPKLNGTEDELIELMNKLFEICESNGLEKSKKIIERIIVQLSSTGYATFIG